MEKFKWINIFIRDILLTLCILGVNYILYFRSWFAACATGMVIVLTTWHLSDLLKERRRLNGRHIRSIDSSGSNTGDTPNNLL